MVNIEIHKNIVAINKKDNPDYKLFCQSYLTKYEEVRVPDPINSFGGNKRYKTVKELRNLFVEDKERVYFSTGLLFIIPPTEYQTVYVESNHIKTPDVSLEDIKHTLDTFDLRDDQCLAVRKCISNRRGIIQMPTATGKSAIITSVIKQFQKENPDMTFLALSPTLSTADNLNATFLENDLDSQVYGHPDKNLKPVNVALVQTLIQESQNNLNLLNQIDAVFYDECLPQGSQILLNDYSTRSISDIYKDDSVQSVMSYDVLSNTYVPRRIIKKYKMDFNDKFWRVRYHIQSLQIDGSISLTSNHKLYVKGKGYIPVTELSCDDLLIYDIPELRDNILQKYVECRVTNIFRGCGNKAEYKYNLEIEDTHCYFADKILVSNCHHLKCDTWNRLNLLLQNAEISLGFSALCIDSTELMLNNIKDFSYESAKIIGSTGKVLLNMTPSYYIQHNIIATPVVFRIHNYIPVPNNFDQYDFQKAIKMCIDSISRKMYIAKVAEMFSRHNYKTLILVSERDYGFEIGSQLVGHGVYGFGISYGSGEGHTYKFSKTRKRKGTLSYSVTYNNLDSLEVIRKFNDNEINVLIGTSHIDEGVDIANLDAVIIAGTGKKDRRIIQRVGRSLRKSKTGKYAYVIDFTDDGLALLNKHSMERLNIYKEVIGVATDKIYNNIDFNQVEPIFKSLENIQDGVTNDSIK